MNTTIIHTSDFHGRLPSIPPCDILTISGDICPSMDVGRQQNWLRSEFYPWLREQPVGHTIATFGNHDVVGYVAPLLAGVTWLMDVGITWRGIRFFGSPWTKPYGKTQAFMVDHLAVKFEAIQPCDVLLTHGPPYGYGDKIIVNEYPERVGSPDLLARIEKVRPTLTVYGHIHHGYGVYQHDGLVLANVAAVDKYYEPTQPMLETKWEDGQLKDYSIRRWE